MRQLEMQRVPADHDDKQRHQDPGGDLVPLQAGGRRRTTRAGGSGWGSGAGLASTAIAITSGCPAIR
jgi:hypothetical protein